MNLKQIVNDLSLELIFRFLSENLTGNVTGNIALIVIVVMFRNEIKMFLSLIVEIINKAASKFYDFFISCALYFKFFIQKMSNEHRYNTVMKCRAKNKELSDWLDDFDKKHPDCTFSFSNVRMMYRDLMTKAGRQIFVKFAIFDYVSEIVRFQFVNKLISLKKDKIVFAARLSEKHMNADTRNEIRNRINDRIREIHGIENEIFELNDMRKTVRKIERSLPKDFSVLEEEKESS